jgi:CHAT domain-containing protein
VVLGNPGGDLPSAAEEAAGVAARLRVPAALGPAASAAAMRQAAEASVLHLAAHSGIGPTGAWLDLADGRLGAGQVIDLRLRPRLVVLASCASGATRQPGLWGSLATSFLVGGAPSVLASLQSIDDRATTSFVLDFYDRLGQGQEPLPALTQVQRAWARQGRPPSRWAGFVLYGVGRSISAPISATSTKKENP